MWFKRILILSYYAASLVYEGCLAIKRRFFPVSLLKESEHIKLKFTSDLSLLELNVKTVGQENLALLPEGRPIVFVCNHRSLIDIPLIYQALPANLHIRMVAKKQLFHIPFLGTAMKAYHFISIDRRRSAKAVQSLKQSLRLFSLGISVLFFPEGTRSTKLPLSPFKRGAFHMAFQADAVILPLAVIGTEHVIPNHKLTSLQFGKVVTACIGKPIDTRNYSNDKVTILVQEVQQQVSMLIEDNQN